MPRGTTLTEYEKGEINAYHKQKLSNRQIAIKIKRSLDVVNRYLRDPSNYNKIKRSGRKPKLQARQKRLILRRASNKTVSCSQIVRELELNVSRWTVGRVLRASGTLVFQKKKTSPALTDRHKEFRLKWAREHMTWDKEWENVIWSDEKKFNLDGPDGFNYYWHDLRKEKLFSLKRNKGGGGVMIWAAFGHYIKSDIVFISGRMNSEAYRMLLDDHLTNIASLMGRKKFLFQQDNAPIHRAKANFEYFKAKKVGVLEWPSLSPDLNPIENVWGLLARRVYAEGRQFTSVEDLKKAIKVEWANLSFEELRKHTSSMPDRIFDVIRLEGDKTKY
jgi:transposase